MNLGQKRRGVTIIETIIVIGIFILIISFSMVVNLNAVIATDFQTEESKIVSMLERARSRAMANMFDVVHGFCYNPPNYIIFRGRTTCLPLASTDENIPANINITSNPSSSIPTFVFNRLTGNTIDATIHITDGIKSADITINNEGTINW